MPRINIPGGAWNEQDKANLVRELMSGELSVSAACVRHDLSQECIRDWLLMFRHSAIEAFDAHLRQTLVPQGIDVGEALAGGFNGSLSEIALADLIQTLTLARRDGVITILQEGAESRIWCAGGEIVDAQSGRLRGKPALYRALAIKSGRVIAEFVHAPRARTIFEGTSALLLDGAHHMDECQALLDRFGAARYRLAPEAASLEPNLGSAERALLRHFSAPRTLRAALGESELGDIESLSLLSRWIERGLLCAETESSLQLSAPDAAGAPSTAPMMLSFLRAGESRVPAPRSLRRAVRSRVAGCIALGFVGWLGLESIFGASSASDAARTAAANHAPEATLAAREAALLPPQAPAVPAPEATAPAPEATAPAPEATVPAPEDTVAPRLPEVSAATPEPARRESVRTAECPDVSTLAAEAPAPDALQLGSVPQHGNRRRARAPVTMASSAVPAGEHSAARAASAAGVNPDGTARRAPRMRIIDEQAPSMRIVE